MGILKSQTDIRSLKQAGQITRTVLNALCEACQPGVSLSELEALANRLLAENRSSAPFKTFNGFNHAICVSVNDEIVNGLPSRDIRLQPGDLVSIATAAEHRHIYAKAARTVFVGINPPTDASRLMSGTAAAIETVVAGSSGFSKLSELLAIVPETAAQYQLTVIEGLGGAGIGKRLHDAPAIPNRPQDLEADLPLTPGLCFTLMPMFSLGSEQSIPDEDGWVYRTADGSLAAHFADTLLVTETGILRITAETATP